MVVYSLAIGPMGTNCYIVETEDKNAIAIDVGGDAKEVIDFLKTKDLKLKKIFLTHGHYDHFYGVDELAKVTDSEVYVHKLDSSKLTSASESLATYMNGLKFNPVSDFIEVDENDEIVLDGLSFKVIHTPGHTVGSCCLIGESVIFSGDTLFRLNVGRTDFPGGSYKQLLQSLKKFDSIEGTYKIYPGHDRESDLDYEKKHNAYIKESRNA